MAKQGTLDLKIKVRIPSSKSKEVFECEVPWVSLESMLARYDAIVEERLNLTDDRKEFLRVTEMVALWQAGRENDDIGDVYRPTRYKRVLRSVLRRRSDRRMR